jgi:hypothetical protein
MAPPAERKRRAFAAPANHPPVKAPFKRLSKPLTPAAVAATEKHKRHMDSQQAALPFDFVDRHKKGLKLLLPDEIYPRPEDVSVVVVVALLTLLSLEHAV